MSNRDASSPTAEPGRRAGEHGEPEGRGAAWTEERGTSDEGKRRRKAPRRRAGDNREAHGRLAAPGHPATPDEAGRGPSQRRPAPAPGPEAAGREAAGREAAGREAAGREAAGREAAGREAAGREAAGREAAGREAAGREAAGREAAEPGAAGRETPGSAVPRSVGLGSVVPGPGTEGRRDRGRGPVVAVTGAARGIGHALTVRLAGSAGVGRVIAIDGHRGDATGVTWRVVDVRDPALAGRLTGVDVVVHTDLDLAPDSDHRSRRAFNVRGAQTVLTAAAAGRVGRVVLVTSAMVYGAQPDNPVPLAESAPLRAESDGSVVGDLLEIEQLAQRSPQTNPGMAVTVVSAGRAGGRGRGHADHPPFRGTAAAGR